ncbi:MAG: hypothetical protein KatS3mg102_0492 [Planctomycetota bacterium]|nr:MAG: hypothetical protein KatS3mg102_0492 [Planctomycetota bacterium]
MTFTAPWGLIALLALPVVLALHLLRRRHERRPVAALFLFAARAQPGGGGRALRPPERTASLLLELVAAALLALLLAGLALGGAPPRQLVVVLDDSYSMAADGFAGRARQAVHAALAGHGEQTRVTLIRSGEPPVIALGPRAPASELAAALRNWRPAGPHHRLEPALELARALAAPGDALLLVTDTPPPAEQAGAAATSGPAPAGLRGAEVVAVGEPLPNAAITAAWRLAGSEPGGERLLVELRAWAAEAQARTLVLQALGSDGSARPVLERPVRLPAGGEPLPLELELPASAAPLELRLAEPDALALDDRALLLREPARRVRAAVALPPTLSAALGLERGLGALPDLERLVAPEAADLVFASAPLEPARPWRTEVIVPPARGEIAGVAVPPFLRRAGHPLLHEVQLGGVLWAPAVAAVPGTPLVEAGALVLMSEQPPPGPGGPLRIYLNLDPERSSLAASVDWPVWLANVLATARARLPGPGPVQLELGAPIVYRRTRPGGALRLRGPDGSERPAEPQALLLSWSAPAPGLYRLLEGERELARYAVAARDPRESDLRRCASARLPAAASAEPAPLQAPGTSRAPRPLRTWLALLLVLVLLADWWVLQRGVPWGGARATGAPRLAEAAGA